MRAYQTHRNSTSKADREHAQLELAIALRAAKLYEASYAILSEIADRPTHLHFQDALPWLARLSSDLPEPADVVERIGKYTPSPIDALPIAHVLRGEERRESDDEQVIWPFTGEYWADEAGSYRESIRSKCR